MSYELKISPKDRAASRLISSVRRSLTMAALSSKMDDGISQQSIADKIGVNRSVINRLLKGTANLTIRTVAEIAWALGYEVIFVIRKIPTRFERATSHLAGERSIQLSYGTGGDGGSRTPGGDAANRSLAPALPSPKKGEQARTLQTSGPALHFTAHF